MVTLLAIAAVFPQRAWNTSFWEFLAFSILLRNLLIWGVFLYEWGGGFSLQFSVFFFCILCILTIKWEWESECLLYLKIHIFLKSWGFSAIVSLNRSYAFRLRVSTFYTNKNFGLLITSEILHSLFIIFLSPRFFLCFQNHFLKWISYPLPVLISLICSVVSLCFLGICWSFKMNIILLNSLWSISSISVGIWEWSGCSPSLMLPTVLCCLFAIVRDGQQWVFRSLQKNTLAYQRLVVSLAFIIPVHGFKYLLKFKWQVGVYKKACA